MQQEVTSREQNFEPRHLSRSFSLVAAVADCLAWRCQMPRPRERVCLQDGLKLNLNRLARNGFIRRGARSGPMGIRWHVACRVPSPEAHQAPSIRSSQCGGSSKDISFLVAEAHEKLDKSFFTRKFGPRLRVEIGAAEFDPKRVWAALNFPCPYRWAAAGACHHEIFVWA